MTRRRIRAIESLIGVIITVAVLMLTGKCSAQSIEGNISYYKKHGIHGLSEDYETTTKTEYQIYKFELRRDKITYWHGHRKYEWDIERVEGSRFYFKDKPWQIKVINGGSALIWIWGSKSDTVYTHIIDNKLLHFKPLKAIWQQPEKMLIGGLPSPVKMVPSS